MTDKKFSMAIFQSQFPSSCQVTPKPKNEMYLRHNLASKAAHNSLSACLARLGWALITD